LGGNESLIKKRGEKKKIGVLGLRARICWGGSGDEGITQEGGKRSEGWRKTGVCARIMVEGRVGDKNVWDVV